MVCVSKWRRVGVLWWIYPALAVSLNVLQHFTSLYYWLSLCKTKANSCAVGIRAYPKPVIVTSHKRQIRFWKQTFHWLDLYGNKIKSVYATLDCPLRGSNFKPMQSCWICKFSKLRSIQPVWAKLCNSATFFFSLNILLSHPPVKENGDSWGWTCHLEQWEISLWDSHPESWLGDMQQWFKNVLYFLNQHYSQSASIQLFINIYYVSNAYMLTSWTQGTLSFWLPSMLGLVKYFVTLVVALITDCSKWDYKPKQTVTQNIFLKNKIYLQV